MWGGSGKKARGRRESTRVDSSGSERGFGAPSPTRLARLPNVEAEPPTGSGGGGELGREGDDDDGGTSRSRSTSRSKRTRRPRALYRQHPDSPADRAELRPPTQR